MSDNATNIQDWKVGDVVTLPRTRRTLKNGVSIAFEQFVESRYLCIREASHELRGILVRVLDRAYNGYAKIVKGQPCWNDDSVSTFYGVRYFCHPLPKANDLHEVLSIIRGNKNLLQQLEDAGMHIDVDSTFWVNDIIRQIFFFKKLQYLDGRDGRLCPATGNSSHNRISIVYFQNGELSW